MSSNECEKGFDKGMFPLFPLLWRYFFVSFFKIMIFCLCAFIALLLIMRLDDIAHFIALGAPFQSILFFTLYQIPYIFPIALPLSCLIASFLFSQQLSNTHELTVLRASGFSIGHLLAPLLLAASFLSIGNFWMASELATACHCRTNELKNEFRSINPLLLLHNKHLMRLKGFYFDILGASHIGESASGAILAIPNKQQQRLHLMIADKLHTSPSHFTGEGVTLLTGSPSENEEDFDDLFIENMKSSVTPIADFSDLLQKKVWMINNDYLPLPLLLTRIQEQRHALQKAKEEGKKGVELKPLRKELDRSLSEITKRSSIAFATFSFTLMGLALGMGIGRRKSPYRLYLVIALTTLYLIAFFVAKGIDRFELATVLYILPHFFILMASLFILRRLAKGIESGV